MDLITLATTAFTLASPFLIKTGEKIAEGIGENVWDFIKKPFSEDKIVKEINVIENQELFKQELIKKLELDPSFEKELRLIVTDAQKQLTSNTQQIVNNNGNIEKQVNIGNISGNIQL